MTLGASARELLTVDRALEVDDHDVALLGGSRLPDRLGPGVAGGEPFHRLLHLFVLDRRDGPLELQRLEIHRLDVGHDVERDGVFEILAFIETLELDLGLHGGAQALLRDGLGGAVHHRGLQHLAPDGLAVPLPEKRRRHLARPEAVEPRGLRELRQPCRHALLDVLRGNRRSEEHTSELQSLMRISYAVFCLKKKKNKLTNKLPESLKPTRKPKTHSLNRSGITTKLKKQKHQNISTQP